MTFNRRAHASACAVKVMQMAVIIRSVIVAIGLALASSSVWAQTPTSAFQGFSVVLVLGDVQEGATSDNIPAAARAALADLKDFLPYRSYRVLDTAWVLASSATRQAVTSRLRGPDEQDYEVTLDRMPVGTSSLQIRFAMSEASDERRADAAHREAQFRTEMSQLGATHDALENQLKKLNPDHPDARSLRQRLADVEIEIEARRNERRVPSGGATLIDTSFTMSLGETVVVGTSRMRGGNKALIVLLTAATRGAKPRE
jgi:hypothetical protein